MTDLIDRVEFAGSREFENAFIQWSPCREGIRLHMVQPDGRECFATRAIRDWGEAREVLDRWQVYDRVASKIKGEITDVIRLEQQSRMS